MRYIGIGKREDDDEDRKRVSAGMRYIGIGKRNRLSKGAPKDGVAKRSVDLGHKYIGLGKRHLLSAEEDMKPDFGEMTKRTSGDYTRYQELDDGGQADPKEYGTWEKRSQVDKGMRYVGIGKRGWTFMRDDGVMKRPIDPALRYIGIGRKREIAQLVQDALEGQGGDPSEEYANESRKKKWGFSLRRFSSRHRGLDPAFMMLGIGRK